MKKKTKSNIEQYHNLVKVYDTVTALEKTYEQMTTAELTHLSGELYNVIYPSLHQKRKVLLNELLDLEVELRIRNIKQQTP